jgi:hypothetical protein
MTVKDTHTGREHRARWHAHLTGDRTPFAANDSVPVLERMVRDAGYRRGEAIISENPHYTRSSKCAWCRGIFRRAGMR